MDKYWTELAAFIDATPIEVGSSLAPKGVTKALRGLTPYERWERDQIVGRVIVHKGLIDEIPCGLLESLFGAANPSFANEVFVVYEVTFSTNEDIRSAHIALAEKAAAINPDAVSPVSLQGLLRKPRVTPYSSCKRRVVAALQAPTLLNIWARSKQWDLQTAQLGDHEYLSEASLLSVPPWDGVAEAVAAVLVTTPAQLENASRLFPAAKKIWIPHNGQGHLIPRKSLDQIDGIVTLSRKVLVLQRTALPELLRKPAWVIPPCYVPTSLFQWSPNIAWSMKSRPETRNTYDLALFSACEERLSELGVQIKLFGQNTPGGFLNEAELIELYTACSCYVSALPPWAGFGLAQHECMAAGVPVAGLYWGDIRENRSDYPAFVDDLDSLAEVVKKLCSDHDFATNVSEQGQRYIDKYLSPDSMDQAITRFIEDIN